MRINFICRWWFSSLSNWNAPKIYLHLMADVRARMKNCFGSHRSCARVIGVWAKSRNFFTYTINRILVCMYSMYIIYRGRNVEQYYEIATCGCRGCHILWCVCVCFFYAAQRRPTTTAATAWSSNMARNI